MKKVVKDFVNKIRPNSLTNNVQRVFLTLLVEGAKGDGWVSLDSFDVPSAAARLRDLRKEAYGGFDIRCGSGRSLGKSSVGRTFYYKVMQKNLTVGQVRAVFGA